MSTEIENVKTPMRLADMPQLLFPAADEAPPRNVMEFLMRIAWDLVGENCQLRCHDRRVVTLTVPGTSGDAATFAANLARDIKFVDTKLRLMCNIVGDGRLPKPEVVKGNQFVVTWLIASPRQEG